MKSEKKTSPPGIHTSNRSHSCPLPCKLKTLKTFFSASHYVQWAPTQTQTFLPKLISHHRFLWYSFVHSFLSGLKWSGLREIFYRCGGWLCLMLLSDNNQLTVSYHLRKTNNQQVRHSYDVVTWWLFRTTWQKKKPTLIDNIKKAACLPEILTLELIQ